MSEAKLNKEYALRLIGVGVLMWAICAWSIYDGHVAWPRENLVMDDTRPILLSTNMTAEAWLSTENGPSMLTRAFAFKKHRVPAKLVKKVSGLVLSDQVTENREQRRVELNQQLQEVFKSPVYSSHDLGGQDIQAVATFLLGLLAVAAVALKVGKKFSADESGLHGSGFGGDVAYADIIGIEWAKWDDKGIVDLTVKPARRIRLDAWHFSGITGIVDEIKAHRPDLAPKAAE
ncbi:MAG: hypothetical protein IJU44_00045 [Kiritimatiellae bacterium]|nr:hypothetical protein [Kiritimatiellia bacterium]